MKTRIALVNIVPAERLLVLNVNGETVNITLNLDGGEISIGAEDTVDLNNLPVISDICSFISTNETVTAAFPAIAE